MYYLKIALLTLSGEQKTISVDNTLYFDDGIKIDNSFIITEDNSNFDYNILNSLITRDFSFTGLNDIITFLLSDLSLLI